MTGAILGYCQICHVVAEVVAAGLSDRFILTWNNQYVVLSRYNTHRLFSTS